MAKPTNNVILWSGVSLDGFMEGPNREIDWHSVDDELLNFLNEELGRMGAFLHGRITYDGMVAVWPTADADPASASPMVDFARIWRDMPKYVYSRSLKEAGWNTTIVREVVPEEVMRMKAEAGGDLVISGADLGTTFRRLGLVDEYRLFVNPVIIGRGRPLFQPSDQRTDLRLLETRTFGNGVVMLRYGSREAA